MHRTERVIFTNMCMITDGSGNVVVQQHSDPNWPGLCFPGGHVEPGESFTDAAVREVLEETGLTVLELQMCGIKDWFRDDGTRYVVHLYRTDKYTGTLKSSSEGSVSWAPLKSVSQLPLAEGMLSTLKVFCEDRISELFYQRENGAWLEVLK